MKANPLGDIRAEADHEMLHHTFVETPDYKTLITVSDRPIVVGRRGSGKSALSYGLSRHWRQVPKTRVVVLAPEEDQMFALRPLIGQFGSKFSLLRAACRLVWRYALLMELAIVASQSYRFPSDTDTELLRRHIRNWCKTRATGVSARLKSMLLPLLSKQSQPEQRIGSLASDLEANQVQDALVDTLARMKTTFVLLIDKLDEGFEADELGIALADGLLLATVDVNDRIPTCQTKLFVRDNIGRAVAATDPDYSRDLEGQVIRLHWDESLLLNLTCTRLRHAFSLDIESDTKTWNKCTGESLRGIAGFRKVLRLTLYRPRDVLTLLNQAFYRALRQERTKIVLEDLESTAHDISKARMTDLHKEYGAIVPGISQLTHSFRDRDPELSGKDASELVNSVLAIEAKDRISQQHFEIVNDPHELVRSLYGVGFLGIKDPTSGGFTFCHDGSSPMHAIGDDERVLVHPCYWMALGLTRRVLADTEAEEIHDDYSIHIDSQTPEIRKAALSKHITALDKIPVGVEGATEFEEWCLRAIRVLFAGQLSNVELHPNKHAAQRRDIVGTVTDSRGVWKRIHEDYQTRQVVFEVKNEAKLTPDTYRQVISYLTGEYGRCGFVINRDADMELRRHSTELNNTREMYNSHNKLIVRITAKFLAGLLSKLRNPQKHDEANNRLQKVLDNHTRLYVAGVTTSSSRKNRHRRRASKRA